VYHINCTVFKAIRLQQNAFKIIFISNLTTNLKSYDWHTDFELVFIENVKSAFIQLVYKVNARNVTLSEGAPTLIIG